VLRQIEAVARARHLDVGDHGPDVGPRLEKSDRLVRIGGFHDPESGIVQDIGIEHSDQGLILDEQEHRAGV
jgi:hypothetical protein